MEKSSSEPFGSEDTYSNQTRGRIVRSQTYSSSSTTHVTSEDIAPNNTAQSSTADIPSFANARKVFEVCL